MLPHVCFSLRTHCLLLKDYYIPSGLLYILELCLKKWQCEGQSCIDWISQKKTIYSQPLIYFMEVLRTMLLNYYLCLINKQSHKNLMHSVINPHSSVHKSVQGRRLRRRRLRGGGREKGRGGNWFLLLSVQTFKKSFEQWREEEEDSDQSSLCNAQILALCGR